VAPYRLESIPISIRSILSNKVRAFLTALGVMFGVAAVIAMLSISEGAKRDMLEQVNLMGANTVFVENSWSSWSAGTTDGLLTGDGASLASVTGAGQWAALRRYPNTVIQMGTRKYSVEVVATTPAFAGIVNLGLQGGRYFDAHDYDARGKVCVLGASLKKALVAYEDAVGKQVKIGDVWFTVIGVSEYKKVGRSRVTGLRIPKYNVEVFVPLSVASYFDPPSNRGTRPQESLDEIVLAIGGAGQVEPASRVIERALERLHHGETDYKIVVPQALLAQSRRTQRTFNIVMATIAGISLLVGGIGIMNIMLASVLERRHEIGIRRATGATSGEVMLQFLTEAVSICLVGCVVGIGLGVALSLAVGHFAEWRTGINALHVVIAVGVASFVGIVSGYYPARRAARLDPVEALRYE
jgi:putative ABC transport system permease protein